MNNRRRGIKFEQEVRLHLIKCGFDRCVTSRYGSKMMDDLKIDYLNTSNFLIQAKTLNGRAKYEDILEEMPKEGIRVLLHRMTKKGNKNFIEKGRYAILNYNDFLNIIYTLNMHKINNIERVF